MRTHHGQSARSSDQDPAVSALVRRALGARDEDARWDAVRALQDRGGRGVLEVARALCDSNDSRERELAADILGQSRSPTKTFHDEAVEILLRLLEGEGAVEVLRAGCIALGHRADPRAVRPLASLKLHPDAEVRHAVAFGLGGHEDEVAIDTLIELSSDVDPYVRDWATFGLASLTHADTPAIRAALVARLSDEDADTQGEAMVGLARRGDAGVLEPLRAALDAPSYGRLVLEAAGELGDARLVPGLTKLRARAGVDRNLLEEAIASCERGGGEHAAAGRRSSGLSSPAVRRKHRQLP